MSETTKSSTQIFNESDSVPLPNVELDPSKSLNLSSLAETPAESNMDQNHNSLLNQESYNMEEEIPDDFLYGYFSKQQQDTWQETPVTVPSVSFESPTPSTPPTPTIPSQQIQKELAEQLTQLNQLNQVQSLLKDIPAKQTQKGSIQAYQILIFLSTTP